jgi:lipopolysaccharide export system protein LptA
VEAASRGTAPEAGSRGPAKPSADTGARRVMWRVRAGTLAYKDREGQAHLEKGVHAQSPDADMQAAALDLFFTRIAGQGQQVERAVGLGGVEVRQGDRRATADRAEYTAAEGKFVLSGGNPTIFDAFRGTTTGRQLTFTNADDTIIIDSEQGSRTLTKHRVEK